MEVLMHLLKYHIPFLLLVGLFQLIKGDTTSAFQFYNADGTIETAKFGWSGDVFNGRFFIKTPNDGDSSVTVKQGVLSAKKFVGDGSSLTGIATDSISWNNIKEIPTGFADGIDDVGTADSAIFAHYADSCGTVTNGSIVSTKIADGAVTDAKIDSVSWDKIKSLPSGFADGIDDVGIADSVKFAHFADSCRTVANGSIISTKIADGAVTDVKIDSLSWGKLKSIPSGFSDGIDNVGNSDSTNFAHYADSCRTVANSSIIAGKIADGAVTDVRIHSVSWNKIKGIPAGFADGVDNEGTGTGQWTKIDNHIYYTVTNGNVGVGVNDSVSSKLTVGGTVKAAWGANQDRYVEIFNNGIGNIHTPNNLKIAADGEYVDISDNTNTIRLKEGKLSIGTLNHQGYDLCVEGTAYCTSGSWSASDERWKKNIKPLNNALQDVLRMKGVEYEWKKDQYPEKRFPQGKQIGLIAQEVEETLPEVVSTNSDGYKSISYEKIVPVLIEAIKEQNKRIEFLEGKLKNIKSSENR